MPRVPTLVTERLVLRPPSPCDLDGYIALGGDPEVMRYIAMGETQTAAQAGYWLESTLAEARHGLVAEGAPSSLPGWMVVIERESQALVGRVTLGLLPAEHVALIGPELCPAPASELGYRFAKPFWGKGYATEAGRALVDYGFDVLGLERINAIAQAENAASNRVLEKLGLRLRTTYVFSGITVCFRSLLRDERR